MTYSTGPPSTNVYKHRPGPPANHMTSIYRRDLEDTVKRESRVTTLLVIWLGHYRASHYLEVCSHLPFAILITCPNRGHDSGGSDMMTS